MRKIKFLLLATCISVVWGLAIIPLAGSAVDNNKLADQHFEKATGLLKQEEYKVAIAEYEKVIKLVPKSKIAQDAQYWIGQSYFKMGQFDRALSIFEKIVKEYPGSGIVPVTQLMISRVQQEKENSKLKTRINDTSDKGVIVDPKTGIQYTKTKTFVGKQDEIQWARLKISPSGKFLLWDEVRVVPLDGGEPFDLVDMPAYRSSLSPDGKRVAFYSGGAIWVIPISPDTGRPTGPAKKLLDGRYWWAAPVGWSPDSGRIIFERIDNEETRGDIWTLSVKDGKLTRITDDPIWEREANWSPDGKTIAYERGYEIWLIPADGGTPRKLIDKGSLIISWSPDSKWIVYATDEENREFRFFHLADGRELKVILPEGIGEFFSWTPDGKKMLFYRSSYDYKGALKVMSASGGPSFELGTELELSPSGHFWSSDSKIIITWGRRSKDDDWNFWIIPLTGGEPFPLKLDASVPNKLAPLSISPDCNMLLCWGEKGLWVVPISLRDARTTGAAVMVSEDMILEEGISCSWSPDRAKVAITYKKDIWILSTEGDKPVQITKTTEPERWPVWSPSGEMIAYTDCLSDKEMVLMLISSSDGEARKISTDSFMQWRKYDWSPDGKELAFLSQGKIWAIPVVSDNPRQIADLENQGLDRIDRYAANLCWSPDGQNIIFTGYRKDNDTRKVFIVPAKGGKVSELAADDLGDKFCSYWSPDGKWVSYDSNGMVKTRPEGAIWKADISELLKK